ncbi:spore maturation protein CgeB [Lachnospiraceae bacterium KH1T2]|nr:spore maturation protein CgeB [Lachnospiraceae bacterium KH1T2]
MKKLNCVYVNFKDIGFVDLAWGILECGHECEFLNLPCGNVDFDEEYLEETIKFFKDNKTDIAFTMNFSPTVGEACKVVEIPYAAWFYDMPVQAVYTPQAKYETNYFFTFDKYQEKEFRRIGLRNICYLPLAANITKTGKLNISKADEDKYSCDISFIGSLYNEKATAYRDYYLRASDKVRNELDRLLSDGFAKWDGKEHITHVMNEELVMDLNIICGERPSEVIGISDSDYFELKLLSYSLAKVERIEMLKKLDQYRTVLYSGDNDIEIPGIDIRPTLAYEEVPKVYYLSKINLSICLHSIISGVPLRTFDIMGTGGFVLSNYQQELEELFDIGKEIVVFHNFEEMQDLAGYYLKHDEERIRIGINGYKKVAGNYTYPIAVSKMLKVIYG